MSERTCNRGYCHKTPGRLRVRVTNVRNNRESAKSLEVLLVSQTGISHVRANHVTGNVLIHFDSKLKTHDTVLKSLEDLGHVPHFSNKELEPDQSMEMFSDIGINIGKNLAKIALKQALRGSAAGIILELL